MTDIAERQKRKAARIEVDLRELAERTGLPLDSKELLLKATTEADPLEGAIFDPGMLFMGIGFAGLKLPRLSIRVSLTWDGSGRCRYDAP